MIHNSNLEKITRISQQIDAYVSAIGRAWVAIYRIPGLSNRTDFSLFLNSVMAILRRNGLFPTYSWNYDVLEDCYTLILLVNGYFRDSMEDVTNAMYRLWNRYSSGSIEKIADRALSLETLNQDKNALWNILQGTAFVGNSHGKINPWHQRQFACCRVF